MAGGFTLKSQFPHGVRFKLKPVYYEWIYVAKAFAGDNVKTKNTNRWLDIDNKPNTLTGNSASFIARALLPLAQC